MDIHEAEAKLKRDMSFKDRLRYEAWGVWFTIEHHFRRITKLCPHDSTMGQVGGKKHFCLDCNKWIPNTEWEEERKAMRA